MIDINDQHVLEKLGQELKSGKMAMFQAHYVRYQSDYMRFAKRYTRDEEAALDVYHDAFIVLYENITSGKLVKLSSSLKTYVFSIAKHMLLTKLRKDKKTVETDVEPLSDELADWYIDDEDERITRLRSHIGKLGDSCREILELFYYRRYSIEAIVETMQYKNANTVKAHKSRCLKQLRQLMRNNSNNPGDEPDS